MFFCYFVPNDIILDVNRKLIKSKILSCFSEISFVQRCRKTLFKRLSDLLRRRKFCYKTGKLFKPVQKTFKSKYPTTFSLVRKLQSYFLRNIFVYFLCTTHTQSKKVNTNIVLIYIGVQTLFRQNLHTNALIQNLLLQAFARF